MLVLQSVKFALELVQLSKTGLVDIEAVILG
jgi:hypothetical protein